MKNITLLVTVILLLLVVSCNRNEKRAEHELIKERKTELNEGAFLEPGKIQYDGKKLALTKEELLEQFGEPDTTYIGGTFQPKKIIKDGSASRNTLVNYKNYLYGPLKFAVWDNKAQISFINFKEFVDTVKHPKINLSSGTSIKEIKQKFPTAYNSRNKEMNSFFGLSPEKYGFKKEDVDWIQFSNEDYSKIELTFLEGDLIWAYFEIGE